MLPFHSFLRGVVKPSSAADFYEITLRYYVYHKMQSDKHITDLTDNGYGIIKSLEVIPVENPLGEFFTTDLYDTLRQSTDEIFYLLGLKHTTNRNDRLCQLEKMGLLKFFRPTERKYGLSYHIKVVDDISVLQTLAEQNKTDDKRMEYFEIASEQGITSVFEFMALVENILIIPNPDIDEQCLFMSVSGELCNYFKSKFIEKYGANTISVSREGINIKIFNDLLRRFNFNRDFVRLLIDVFISDYEQLFDNSDFPKPSIYGLSHGWIVGKVLKRVEKMKQVKWR